MSEQKKVSRKRKTVHRSGVTPKPTPTPTHACQGCGAPFPLLDAMAKQYGMDWSKAGILCGPCQQPMNINVKVSIDTKPFEDVMKEIGKKLAEFTNVVGDLVVIDDVQIKEAPKPKLVGESFKVNFTPTPHMNVRVVEAPMEFAKLRQSWADSLRARLKKSFGG